MNTPIENKSNAKSNILSRSWNRSAAYVSTHKLVSVIVLVVVIGVIYWGVKKTDSASAQTRYVTATVQNGTIVTSVSGTGQVSAETDVSVQPQASGTIIAVPVTDGQSVNAGDLIAEIDPTNAEQSVQNAKASLESSQLSLQKLEEPPTALELTQDQDAITEGQQSIQQDQENLSKDYQNAFTAVSNAFLDLPNIVSGVDNTLYKTNSNGRRTTLLIMLIWCKQLCAGCKHLRESAVTACNTPIPPIPRIS